MSATTFAVPAHVERNRAQRALADHLRTHRGSCAGPGPDGTAGTCTAPPAVSRPRWGGRWCTTHDPAPGQPVPDPTRTLRALRERAGLRTDYTPGFRTVSDERAENKGQRVSSARRAAARGDQ